MAFVPLVPGTFNATFQKTMAASFALSVINGPTGTPIDFSAWTSLTATISPPAPVPYGTSVNFGTVTGATGGKITLQTNDTDFASIEPGSARLTITGKPTSGDIVQIIAVGAATIQAP